jgi:hypothetical protein
VNGKAALSSILARSNLGEAKGSDFASGLPRTIVSRALSTASGLMLIADRKLAAAGLVCFTQFVICGIAAVRASR